MISAMQGYMLIDKPKGWTSFDVVNYVRKIVATTEGKKPKNCKVGHTGTLDPLATGLLVILVGKEYTRRAGELSKQDKTYDVTMKLGEESATGDEEGAKTAIATRKPSEVELKAALVKFTGSISQVPPAFSAIKVNGQRAYDLARKGQAVVLQSRTVMVHGIELIKYDYPFVRFVASVSSGTYIRSLVEDLGRAIGTGAYMSDLRRIQIGDFDIESAVLPNVPELLSNLRQL